MSKQETTINRRLALGVRIGVGVAALSVAIGIFALLFATRQTAPRVTQDERALPVEAITAQSTLVPRRWPGYGAARALEAADIAAEVAGVVVDRPARIDAGVIVERGELIVAIDADEYEQALARAENAIENLEASLRSLAVEERSLEDSVALAAEATDLLEWELNELTDAAERGAASDQEVNRLRQELTRVRREEVDLRQRLEQIPARRGQLEAQMGVERANARLAEINLNRSRILSPINGVLQSVDVKVGERVAPGTPIARVVDLRRLEIPLRTAVGAATSLQPGDRATVRVDDRSGLSWEGQVARIAPEADARSRTIAVFLEIEQDPRDPSATLLRPGQFVVGDVYDSRRIQRFLAPRNAVTKGRVFVIGDDERVRPREVRVSHYLDGSYPDIDPRETQWAAIESGLSPGERIAISNLDELSEGMLVDPSPPRVDSARAAARDGAPSSIEAATP